MTNLLAELERVRGLVAKWRREAAIGKETVAGKTGEGALTVGYMTDLMLQMADELEAALPTKERDDG